MLRTAGRRRRRRSHQTRAAAQPATRRRALLLAPRLAAGLALGGTGVLASGHAPSSSSWEFPREETVITSGTQWGPPSSWNPLQGGGQAMGVRGLLYETLFVFDPWTPRARAVARRERRVDRRRHLRAQAPRRAHVAGRRAADRGRMSPSRSSSAMSRP